MLSKIKNTLISIMITLWLYVIKILNKLGVNMSANSFIANVNKVANSHDSLMELNDKLPQEALDTLLGYDYSPLLEDLNSAESDVKNVSANMGDVNTVAANIDAILNVSVISEEVVQARNETFEARDEAVQAKTAAELSEAECKSIKENIDTDYTETNERLDNSDVRLINVENKLGKYAAVETGGANQVLTITTDAEGNKVAAFRNPQGGSGEGGVSTPASASALGLVKVPTDSDVDVDIDGNLTLNPEIRQSLSNISSELTQTEAELKAVDTKLDEEIKKNDADITNLQNGVSDLENSVSSINGAVSALNGTVNTLSNDTNTLNADKADKTQLNTFNAEQFTLTGTAVSMNIWTGTQVEYDALSNKAEIFLAMIME